MGTHDFSRLPTHLQPVGTPVQVVTMRATSTAPDVSRQQQNEAALKRFRELQAMRPKATTPTPAPKPSLPTAEESERQLAVARTALAKAIQLRDEAQSTADAAGEALTRGQDTVDEVRSQLATLGDVSGLIARWCASRTAAGKPSDPLPSDLVERRERHADLTVKLQDRKVAIGLLQADHETAQGRLAEMQGGVKIAARRILHLRAESLARDVADLQHRAFEKKRKLVAMLDAGVLGAPHDLPPGVMSAIRDDPEYAASISPREGATLRQGWKALADALQTDPMADASLHIGDG